MPVSVLFHRLRIKPELSKSGTNRYLQLMLEEKKLNLLFSKGPIDGLSFSCPLVPPNVFYLPNKAPNLVSTYVFTSVGSGGDLVYEYQGATLVTEKTKRELIYGTEQDIDYEFTSSEIECVL